MYKTPWFERTFLPIEDIGIMPSIIERLEGTAIRLSFKTAAIRNDILSRCDHSNWSIKKEIGHLADLEPLWYERLEQMLASVPLMAIADLTNRKTHDSYHDNDELNTLINIFSIQRDKFVTKLRFLAEHDLIKSSIHPRLNKPMKVIDLAYFVAEHDDHHLAQITYLKTLYN